jgi:large subunit ribosomal protein L13
MSVTDFEADLVVDARDCILGRVASEVAERALDDQRVAVVNAEQAVITGRKEDVMETFRKRRDLGSDRGPAYPKQPDRMFKRSVRGMLPHKKPRGREAYENVRVYIGNPTDEDGELIEGTSLDRLSNIKFVQLGEISEQLGANRTW